MIDRLKIGASCWATSPRRRRSWIASCTTPRSSRSPARVTVCGTAMEIQNQPKRPPGRQPNNQRRRLLKNQSVRLTRNDRFPWLVLKRPVTVNLHLFNFDTPPKGAKEIAEGYKNSPEVIRRATEAEVTCAFREQLNYWPLRQHEIHVYDDLAKHPYVVDCRDFVLRSVTDAMHECITGSAD